MKKILLSVGLSFCCLISLTQNYLPIPDFVPSDSITKTISYNRVYEIPGLSKSELLTVAKKYYIDILQGLKGNIKLEDAENGTITFKVYFQKNYRNGVFLISDGCNYEMDFICKEGRFKCVIIPKEWLIIDSDYNTVSLRETYPLEESTGLLKKQTDERKLRFYPYMDEEFKVQLDNIGKFFNEQAAQIKKARDF